MDPLPRRSSAFEAYVAPARPRAQLWRTGLGVLLAAAVWTGTAAGLVLGAASLPLGGATAERTLVLAYLLSFGGLALGLALALRLLHRRGFASLVGPDPIAAGRDFLRGVGIVALVTAATLPLNLFGEAPEQQMALGIWLLWLPLGLAAVLVQTTSEELAFRGYLQGNLAARFRSPLAWWLVPAVAFGLLHWNTADYGANAPLAVAAVILMALVAGDVTARRGNIGLATGLHFANNLLGVLVVATPSPVSALALFVSELPPEDVVATRTSLLLNIGVVAGAYAIWIWWRRPPP